MDYFLSIIVGVVMGLVLLGYPIYKISDNISGSFAVIIILVLILCLLVLTGIHSGWLDLNDDGLLKILYGESANQQ